MKTPCILIALSLATTAFAADWYVAKDGDDNNSGATRAEAKATIAEGYACLTANAAATVGDRLVLCDGEWTSADFGSTLVLSNGWEVIGEHGRNKTTLKSLTAGFRFFSLASSDSAIRGLTIDFNRDGKVEYKTSAFEEPKGTIDDCDLINYYSTWTAGSSGMVRISNATAVITNCVFRKCQNVYNGPSAIWLSLGANAKIVECSFVDCVSGTSSHSAAGTIFSYRGVAIVRNCLFLRSIVYGAKASSYGSNCCVVGCGVSKSNLTVENCTFVGCRIYRNEIAGMAGNNSTEGTIAIRNCLAWDNSNDAGPVGFSTARGTISYCAADVEPTGTANVLITADNTIFQNPLADRYIPMTGPAVDGGVQLDWMTGAKDVRGFDRTIGSAPDIGCYEFRESATYYVAKDGDDANSGLSKGEAKATLAAGYALLSGWDEKLVICDGTYELDVSALTLVISNGWTLAGENGRDATTIKLKKIGRDSYKVLKLTDTFSEIRDITFDLNNVSFSDSPMADPKGRFTRCAFLNSNVTSSGGSDAFCRISGTSAPIFTDCVFRNAKIQHNGGSVFWLSETTSWPKINGCSFIDCVAGTAENAARSTIFAYRGNCEIRNCLFLRNIVKGATDNAYGDGKQNHVVSSTGTRTLKVENCSFIDCEIQRNPYAGALGIGAGGNIQAVNCFAYGTTNTTGTANLMTNVYSSGTITFSHCASDKLVPGEANVVLTDANFNYRSKRNGDFTVKRGPTIDAGTNLTWMAEALDLMGRPRIIGKSVDIGCFELETSRATRLLVR